MGLQQPNPWDALALLKPAGAIGAGTAVGVGAWVAFRPVAFAGRRLAASVAAALVAETFQKRWWV
jgi:hypothetical protein